MTIPQNIDLEKLQSQIISFLRFPLIVGVVFIHCGGMIDAPQKGNVSDWYYWIIRMFSGVLPLVCVPLFFIISGFLFFYKNGSYRNKLYKRMYSLGIPYLIWNILGIIIICFKHFALPKYFPKWNDWDTCLNSFLNIFRCSGTPPDYPLWFIRDLIVIVIFSFIIV